MAAALRQVRRIEPGLFIIEWTLDTGMQHRTQVGLNKGETHHALKNALRIGLQGEFRDRTTEGRHYRIKDLNLLTAIIIYSTPCIADMPSRSDAATGWICPTPCSPISSRSDGHISTSQYLWPKDANA